VGAPTEDRCGVTKDSFHEELIACIQSIPYKPHKSLLRDFNWEHDFREISDENGVRIINN
jgi:hypothetical protein